MVGPAGSSRRRIAVFAIASFAISWGTLLLLIGPAGVALDPDHLAQLLGFGYIGMLAGPSVSALVLIAVLDGRAGLRALRDAVLRWRVGGRWWLTAVLLAPLSIVAVLVVLSLVSQAYVPRLALEEDRGALLTYIAISATLTGVFEELGWTGLAVRTLLPRYRIVRTSLIVGLLAGAWNFLVVYLKELSVPTSGELPLAIFLVVGLFTWQVAFRVLMVWVYERSESVLLAMVMQASLVAAWTGMTPLELTRVDVAVFYLALTAVWSFGAALAVRDRARKSTSDRRMTTSSARAMTGGR